MSRPVAPRLRRLLPVALVFVVLGAGAAFAIPPVQVTAGLETPKATPGGAVVVTFHVAVPSGQHLYAPTAKKDVGIPIEATLADAAFLAPGKLEPKGGQKTIDVPEVGPTDILEGTFDVSWRLKVAADAAAGKRELKGSFRYQVCTEKGC